MAMVETGQDYRPDTSGTADWLALVVGNSRLHWAAFAGDGWLGSWHTRHLTPAEAASLCAGGLTAQAWQRLGLSVPQAVARCPAPLALWLTGVVRSQLDSFQPYPQSQILTLAQVPLPGRYPTLGVDRALCLLGAGATYGWPVLVVDCGTALTFTAGTDQGFAGGAILPGLRSQLRALHEHTDALPLVALEDSTAPLAHRWASTTPAAILSGVFHGQLASIQDFIADWWGRCPGGQVVLTGGDSPALATGLSARYGNWANPLRVDSNLMFWGMRVCRYAAASRERYQSP